jgi:transcriptional regulator with XRE-family HTH domain
MYSLEPTPTEVRKELANRFRILRKKSKISQKEMAERSGVSLGSLKRFENTGKISLESLLKLMHVVGRINEISSILTVDENREDIEKLFTK